MTTRRRNRLRDKALVTDPTTRVDMSTFPPPVELNNAGQVLWDGFAADPPFWWEPADLAMVGMLCAATDATRTALRSTKVTPAGKAAIVKEWRSLAAELGLSPTSRSRLKLTEAKGAVAAGRVQDIRDERDKKETDAIDLDDLPGE